MKHQVTINGTVTVDTSQLAALASLGLPMTIRPVTDEPAVRRGRPPRIVMTHEPYAAPTQAPIPVEPVAAVAVAAAPAAEKPKAEKATRVKAAKPEPAVQDEKRKPDPKAPQSNRDSVVAAFTELIDVDFDSAAAVLEKLKVGKFSEIGDDRLAEAAGLIAAGLKANTQPQQ